MAVRDGRAQEGSGRRSREFAVRDDRDLQELLAYVRTLQDREGELIESVRILRRKYHACKAENRHLVWNKLSSVVMVNLPPPRSDLEETQDRVGPYTLGAPCGRGASATVRSGTHASGHSVAVKVVEKAGVTRYRGLERLRNEMQHTRAAQDCTPHVAALLDVLHAPDRLYLVLEHGGVDLYRHADRVDVDERRARDLVKPIASAIASLQTKGIVHHDLKGENVLVDAQGHVRLTDFGLSECYTKHQRERAFYGSPGFYAPEVATGDYDPWKVDVWSLGCVALELLAGRDWFEEHWLAPCHAADGKVDRLRRKLGPASASAARCMTERGVSDQGVVFVLAALAPTSSAHPDAQGLAAHAWFRGPLRRHSSGLSAVAQRTDPATPVRTYQTKAIGTPTSPTDALPTPTVPTRKFFPLLPAATPPPPCRALPPGGG